VRAAAKAPARKGARTTPPKKTRRTAAKKRVKVVQVAQTRTPLAPDATAAMTPRQIAPDTPSQ
jgi:hypothetical protein